MKSQQQNNDTKWMGGGLLTAFTASICCITPVVAVTTGLGGIASAFSWLEPFRPWFIGFTVLLLGFAWYQKLKLQWDPNCECKENPSLWQSKGFLGIGTVLATLLLAFPYYSDAFFPNQKQQVVYVSESQVETVTFNIEGMTCTGYEATVENAAAGVEGVLDTDATYENEEAIITYDKGQTDKGTIVKAIDATGFKVKN